MATHATILLLCSEPVIRVAVGEILERAGYLVLSADNLGTAVKMIADCPVDLLVTYPYIAEISGHEAAKYLRTKIPGLAVLLVAGLPEDDRVQNWADLDQFGLFPPPFTAAQLLEKVREILKTVTKE
jgi:DNA-binding NtrC family response regulator